MTAMNQPQMPHPVATQPNPSMPRPMPQAQPMPAVPQAQPMPAVPQAQPMPAALQAVPQVQPMPAAPMPMPQMPEVAQLTTAQMPAAMSGHLPLGQEEDILSREGGEKVLPQISIHAFCDRLAYEADECKNLHGRFAVCDRILS